MDEMILVYITCEGMESAKKIAKALLEKKLCGCANIFPYMEAVFFGASGNGSLDSSKEVVLIAKTFGYQFQNLEKEVLKIHSYEIPCIFALPVKYVSSSYLKWLQKQMEKSSFQN